MSDRHNNGRMTTADEAPAPLASPPPPPKLYDAELNKRWGIVTREELREKYKGNQSALATLARRNRTRRHEKTWADVVERASEGVVLRELRDTVRGTKRLTETMTRLTGYTPPTVQSRIQLGDFFPWAAPELRAKWEASQIEREPGRGVADFEMPSDRVIIEIGQEAAKRAGAWGLPQVILINPTTQTVEVIDLPKNIGWLGKKKVKYPWWDDQGPLAAPWDVYHLLLAVQEPGQDAGEQSAWMLDLFVRDGKPIPIRGPAVVVRLESGAITSSADALAQLKPHVSFLMVQKAKDAAAREADLARWPLTADSTGKDHLTLNEIAVRSGMMPNVLAELLHRHGYLDEGGLTPVALDDGIATIVGGASQFNLDGIRAFLDKAANGEIGSEDQQDRGEQDAETIAIEVGDDSDEAPRSAEAEEDESDATEGTAQPSRASETKMWHGGGMRVIATPVQRLPNIGASPTDQPYSEPVPGTSTPDGNASEATHEQVTEQLEAPGASLRAAEEILGQWTATGEFAPHVGDNEALRNRIKMAAEAVARAYAALTNTTAAYQRLQAESEARAQRIKELEAQLAAAIVENQTLRVENETLARRTERLEAENAELTYRGHESEAQAEVISFQTSSDESGSTGAASH